jgi:hypothetical protein
MLKQIAMEKCVLYVYLMNRPATGDGEREYNPNCCRLNHRVVGNLADQLH